MQVVSGVARTEPGTSELQFVSKQGRQASRNRAGKPDPMRSPALESRTGTSVGSGVEGHAEKDPREAVAKTARSRGGGKGGRRGRGRQPRKLPGAGIKPGLPAEP